VSIYVSLLRGINVGGQKQLRMETLRGIYEGLDFSNVRSYVQSGNIVFESSLEDKSRLGKQIEAAIAATCSYPVPVFIRQAYDLQQILMGNPFLTARNKDLGKLHVTFLYETPPESAWSKVITPAGNPDEFARAESAMYLFCPNGYGKTKLSNSFFERKLGVLVTTRNWNTVKALYKMVMED
jgi:uncharacterized protein (DUF1697 family)